MLGGHIGIERIWYDDRWYFNRAWEPLRFNYDTLDGSVKSIQRNDYTFERDSTNPDLYRYDVTPSIARSADGWRWSNRQGDWIAYDAEGRMQAYGDRTAQRISVQYDAQGRRSAVLDPHGQAVITYDYDGQSRQPRFVRSATRSVEYRYSGEQLVEVIDVRGNASHYTYEGNRLKTHSDAEGHTTTLSYAANGQLIEEKGPDGQATAYRYEYDKTHREYYVRQTDPDGKVSERWYDREGVETRRQINGQTVRRMRYDGNHRIITDRRGLETRYERDTWDNITKTVHPDGASERTVYDYRFDKPQHTTDALGRLTEYQYDAHGNLLSLIEAKGSAVERRTDYTYDHYGQRLSETRRAADTAHDSLTQYRYDNAGNLIEHIDPEGHSTTYTHDERGNVLSRTDANGHTWTYTYDAAGHLLSAQDPLEQQIALAYDKAGNRTAITDARSHTSNSTYDARHRRHTQSDYAGNLSRLSYDVAGRLTAITDPLGNQTGLAYDSEGRLIVLTDAAGNRIEQQHDTAGGADAKTAYPGLHTATQYPTYRQTYDYDRRNRRTKTIDHLDADTQQISTTTYDKAGNRIAATDAQGRTTVYRYDALDRLTEIIDPLNQSTAFRYDNRDNLIAVTDPNGHTTAYQYDKADRKIAEIRPMGETTTYQYDANGNLTRITDPDGRRSEIDYDAASRPIQQRHYLPDAAEAQRSVDLAYDPNGNLISWDDGSYSASYTYDENNRKTQETVDYGAFSLSYRYSYDAAGRKIGHSAADGTRIAYHWDKDRLQRLELVDLGSVNYARYRWSQPDLITYPGGSKRTLTLDALQRPQSIAATDPASNPVMTYQYTYDPAGNITQKADQTHTYDYQYDALDRLIEAASILETEGWHYDPNGNRTEDNLNPGDWHYSDNDELQQSPQAVYTYDQAGNPTSKTAGGQVTHYRYNAENRLSRVEDNAGQLIGAYTYDPLGRRIAKTTQTGTIHFHYTDEGLAGEYDTNGNPIRSYGYRPDSTWTTDPVYQKRGEEVAFYQNDHLGTPQRLVKINGAVVWSARYRAFGEVVEESRSWENPLRLPGQYYDQETGSYYNYFRDYDPTIGRYAQRDPMGLAGGLNAYRYANVNPIAYSDALGLTVDGQVIGVYIDNIDVSFLGTEAAKPFYNDPKGMTVFGFMIFTGAVDFSIQIHCVEYDDCKKPINSWRTFVAGHAEASNFKVPMKDSWLPFTYNIVAKFANTLDAREKALGLVKPKIDDKKREVELAVKVICKMSNPGK